ncbi:MAG: phospholipase D-like domain-containing protein [Candidatus Bathyarchaeia archaeon]|nr:hypothetical protein [Candidatus Bathyarchaeota archaeon]
MHRYGYVTLSILMLILGLILGYIFSYIQLQPEIMKLASILEDMAEELSYMEEARLELTRRISELEKTLDIINSEYGKLVNSINVSVIFIPDRIYFEEAYRLICSAKNSVYLLMYLAEYKPSDESCRINKLIDMVVYVYLKGVDVKILFDKETSLRYPETIARLKSYGIPVRIHLDADGAMHSRLLVVDRFYVLLGSHDWTEDSLNRDHEYSVMIASSIYGSEAAVYAENLWSSGYEI